MMTVSAKISESSMRKFRTQFGDSSNQALLRLGVEAGKGVAILTAPPGRGKKQIIKNIITGARTNIADIPAGQFNKIRKQKKPFFKFRRGWAALRENQILEGTREINSFIEDARNNKGRVRRYPVQQKAICKTSDMNKTLVQRKKMAGMAKGSWLGAAMDLARKAKGAHPPKVGKNFMAWAQKHKDLGSSRFLKRRLGKSEVFLISAAPATKDEDILPPENVNTAIDNAWKQTLNWYKREVRAKNK